jgi:hypothetical protein
MNTKEDAIKKEDEIEEKDSCGITDESVCTEEETLVEEVDRDVINDILSIFEDPDSAYPLEDVIEELKGLGYKNPGGAITLALQDDVIYVDSVEDSGMVYLAVTQQDGEE